MSAVTYGIRAEEYIQYSVSAYIAVGNLMGRGEDGPVIDGKVG